jgi:hypothetical protein
MFLVSNAAAVWGALLPWLFVASYSESHVYAFLRSLWPWIF